MSTRKVKDARDLDTGEKIYFKSHAKATYMSNGKNIEDALNDGDFLTKEIADEDYQPKGDYALQTDIPSVPVNVSAFNNDANYVDEDDLATKSDKVTVVNHGTSDTTFALTPNVYHQWGTVTSLTLTLAAASDATVYNEYMFEFVSGSTATTLSLPDTISWVAEPSIEANKTYQCSIVNNVGVIASASNA